MANPQLHSSLQENLLAVLGYDEEHGRPLSRMVDPVLFEGEYRTVADRLVAFWRKYDAPPGAAHIADIFADIIEDKSSRRSTTLKRIVQQLDELWDMGVNSIYVVQQHTNHVRVMLMKNGIVKAAEKLQSGQELAIAETEEILNDLLRARQISFDPGVQASDVDFLLDYLETKYSEFTMGIKQLDENNIVPFRGALLLIIAAAKAGKSWQLIHIGKQAFLQRKKVVHISLEMSEGEVLQRYYQCLYSIAKRDAKRMIEVPKLKQKEGKLIGIDYKNVKAQMTFSSEGTDLSMELKTRVELHEKRLSNIYIKRFPPRSLTANGIRAYLDNLEASFNFIPDMLILDYAGLMKTDTKLHRIETGRNVEELRAIAVERNMAVVSAWQSNRKGAETGLVGATNVSEDWSVVQTADIVLSLSRTDEEKARGLARLFVDMVRGEEDGWGLILTQALEMGQFVLDAARIPEDYWEMVKPEEDEEEEDDEG